MFDYLFLFVSLIATLLILETAVYIWQVFKRKVYTYLPLQTVSTGNSRKFTYSLLAAKWAAKRPASLLTDFSFELV